MANWKHKIFLGSFFHNDEIPVDQKGRLVADALKKAFSETWLDYSHDDYDDILYEIIERFENVTGWDDVSPTEEFDIILDELYNYGDLEVAPFGQWPRNKMLWVDTYRRN